MGQNTPIHDYAIELLALFKRAPTKHDAHRDAQPILQAMASDRACLRAALAAQIRRRGGLNTRHFPALGLPIVHNAHFSLVANCFLPLPTGETDVTANSIHHHGDLLLSTVTTFGPGYEHWRFTTPMAIDKGRDLYSIDVIDRIMHGPNHVAFVDCFMPHAVMFPASLTVTFALWSSRYGVTWRDHLKHAPGVHAGDDWVRRAANRLGASAALRINVEAYLDYYPDRGGLKGMPKRIQFRRGPNEDYLYSLFHILQRTGNEDLAPDDELLARLPIDNPRVINQLRADLRRGVTVACRLSEGLHWLDHMNFKIAKIEQMLSDLKKVTPALRPANRV